MKKITRLSIFTVALMTLASSCNRDEAGLNPSERYGTVTITADAARTKTVLDGGAVKWEDGDEIALRFTHDTKEAVVGKFATSIEAGPVASADFTGTVALDVLKSDGGYHDGAFAVYPHSALTAEGVEFALPAAQQAREDGSFAARLNLTSASLSLADIRDDGKASATFRNALSILRFSVTGDDVTSVTITGTAPLAGSAPVVFSEDGRLVIDTDAEWKDAAKEMSVTLTPADGSECFAAGTVYNLLVWPGTHQSLTATLDFKEYGAFDKTSVNEFTFAASKFYTLDFNADSETLVKEITDPLDAMDLELPDLEDRIAELETTAEKISLLLDQIQSVALMTEYLDNAVYAPYAQFTYSKLKKDIRLDYMVRPAKAAGLLLDICAEEGNLSDVLSARIDYKDGSLGTLTVTDATLDEDILTVVVDAESIANGLYEGTDIASVALQISDGNTEILSDFARLVPKASAMMNITKTEDIPVLKGAGMSMGFFFGASDMSKCRIQVENHVGFAAAPTVSYNNNSGSGYLYANFAEDADLSQMSVDLVLTCGEDSDRQTLTFAEGEGRFEVQTSGEVDYIGGEVSIEVVQNDFTNYSSELRNAGDWIYQTDSGNNDRLTVNQNSGAARSAEVVFNIISTGNITYTKSVPVSQKAYGSPIDESRYYQDGSSLQLNQAVSGITPLNIVILGDGYQKKDLQKGGKFERSALSACDAFFGVAPFSHFRYRFNVYMVAYESVDEGIDITSQNVNKNTYFDAWCEGGGNTLANCSTAKVENVVQNTLNLTGAAYYRTVVIVLANTSEGVGSCTYPVQKTAAEVGVDPGDGYASFAIGTLTANNTETNNLIRHEIGGHAFGRLGDEYPSKTWDSNVNDMHAKGWYRNITVDKDLWDWDEFIGLSGYEDVEYYQPNSTYWCPINHTKYSSIMYNNTSKFNAPCRRIIYERIIRQTEGYNAYSWEKFLGYDKQNIQ